MRKALFLTCVVAAIGLLGVSLWPRPETPPPIAAAPQPKQAPASVAAPNPSRITPPAPTAPALLPEAKQEPIAAFASWLQTYRFAPADTRAKLLADGEKLARERQPALYNLIAKDPAAALAAAVNEPARRLLPQSITSLLEQPASAKGDLVVIVDDSAHHRINARETYRQAQINGQVFDAYVYGRRAMQQTKYGTSLIGITMQDRMAVLEQPARVIARDEVPQGVSLQPALVEDPAQTVSGEYIVQVAGAYYPAPSAAVAARVVEQWTVAESRPGPVLQALGDSLPGLEAAPAQIKTHQFGTQSMLVIIADFSDVQGRPVDTIDGAHPAITSTLVTQKIGVETADFFTQASYGKSTIGTPTISAVLRLQGTLADYAANNNTAGLKNEALAAATTAGLNPSSFDRVMVVIADTHGLANNKFSWSGLAELGGSFSWINGNMQLGVLAHELGHNYGLSHAKLWQVPGNDPVDPAGSALDYGDPFDIMGGAIGDATVQPDPPNPFYLNNLGWLPDSAVETITTNSAQPHRVYRFDHQDALPNQPLALRISRGEGIDYWIGYRRKYQGYPGFSDMGNGAYVFWAKQGVESTELIDIDTPGTNAKDASLNTTQTFNDSAAGITLQVTQAGGSSPGEYLDVQVTFSNRIAFQHKVNNVDEQAGTATLIVERLNNASGSITAHYTTVPGTALAGQNYTTTTGALNWADGDMSTRTITVPLLVDAGATQSTSFTVTFDLSSGCVFPSGRTATVNIQKKGSADSLFVHPFLTSNVNALSLQPDGKLVIGGNFSNTSAPVTASGISRLTASGSLDTSFDDGPGVSALPVTVLARQADGMILVGGEFTSIRGVARNRIARLQPSGALDYTFDPGTGPGNAIVSDNVIQAITVQPDGKILVGGKFTTWNGAANRALVRLNADGTLDSTFTHFDTLVTFFGTTGSVEAVALQPIATAPHFSIIASGLFARQSGANARGSIVRLNANGTRDTSFDLTSGPLDGVFVSQVTSLAVQPDGKIVAGGQFTTFNGAAAKHLVRLNNNGTNDGPFLTSLGAGLTSTQALCDVTCLRVQADGGILVGGYFEKSAAVPQSIARFLAAGTRDTAFMPAIESWVGNGVTSMELTPDNTLYISLNNSGGNPNVVKRLFTGSGALGGVVQFASVDTSVSEGTTAAVAVQRTGGSSGQVSVNYQTIGRSAVAGTHFTATSGTLVWNNGDAAAKNIAIPTTLNGTTDPDLVFEVHLGIPIGGVSIGQRGVASVTIQDTAAGAIPKVNFEVLSSTFTESTLSQTVRVTLDLPHTDTIVVPFALTGTAVAGLTKDYTVDPSSVTFGNGVVSQDITINLKQDTVVEAAKTIIITLKPPTSGTALLGNIPQHTVNITDDDVKPAFTLSPSNVLASVGTLGATFHSTASGSPSPTYQWYKNAVKITSAATSPDYSLSNLQLSHAGKYSVIAKNTFGTATAFAELGIVDTTPKVVTVLKSTTATLTVVTAGNALSYTWTKGGVSPLAPPRITASAKSLIIKTTDVATDAGVYQCLVGQTGGASIPVMFTLKVIDAVPLITNASLPTGRVGQTYPPTGIIFTTDANRTPASFSTLNLPAGLACDPKTGIITGKPTAATKPNTSVTLKATNVKGTGTLALPIVIEDLLPNTAGIYTGLIGRDATLNAGLGGRISITVAVNGTYTGTLTLGLVGYPFKGGLETTSSTATGTTLPFKVTGGAMAQLIFILDPAQARITTGLITTSNASASFTAWRGMVPGAFVTGYHTFALKPDPLLAGSESVPQGLGYGSFTMPATAAAFSVAGVLADGTAFTSSSTMGISGEIIVYQCLYTGGKGSLLGKLTVSNGTHLAPLNTDSFLTGALTWTRPHIVGRTYDPGFANFALAAEGGRINATKTGVMPMGFTEKTDNASLTFTGANVNLITPVPDLLFTLKKGGLFTVPGLPAHRTGFAFVAGTGAFNGTFTQLTPARTGTYKGMLVNHQGTVQGDGWFTLPQLLPTLTTSPILSGAVKLEAK